MYYPYELAFQKHDLVLEIPTEIDPLQRHRDLFGRGDFAFKWHSIKRITTTTTIK